MEQIANTIPDDYFLGQNYPNPFNPSTTIEYRIKKAGPVTLSLYNMLGQKLVDLVDEVQEPGSYKLTVDLSDLGTSGIYLYMIKAPGFKKSRMMTLIK